MRDTAARAAVLRPRLWAQRRAESPFLLLAPALLIVGVLAVFPFLASLALSFTNYSFSLAGSGVQFVGFTNWGTLLQDAQFWSSLWVTVQLVIYGVVLQFVLGLGLALLLHLKLPGHKVFGAIFLIPMLFSPVSTAFMVGKMMFADTGPLDALLRTLHLPVPQWYADAHLALLTQVIVDTWEWTPFMILLLFAGLQAISAEYYEAAAVDGASRWTSFRHITLPLIAPIAVAAILIRAILLFQIIDIPLVTNGGGPGTATMSLGMYSYQIGFTNFNLGYAATVGYAQLIILIVATLLFLGVARRLI